MRFVCSPSIVSSEPECETPKADNLKVLEAAAALTEMAGGPRVNPSCSPPSVRHPGARRADANGNELCTPQKDTSCCTPAKRRAAVPLWDGALCFPFAGVAVCLCLSRR